MSMYSKRSRLGLLSSAVLVSSMVAGAQTYRGGIAGTVKDSTGAAVPNAKVTLTGEDTGFTRDMQSTGSGDYAFQDLQIGNYSLTVSGPGFSTVKTEHIAIRPGQIFGLDPKLTVSSGNETVEIQANTVAIDTVSSTNSNVVNEKAVANIPLNGRDFTQLVKITPGYNGAGSINGTRTNQNNYQIDGADSNDIWQNNTAANQGGVGSIAGVTLPVEAIDQFTVQSSGNAEAGRNAGGLISLGLKTGTNSFHGSAYFYGRSEFFAARDKFQGDTTRKQKARNQQFGGSIGGPIIKDKLFFFTNYERQKYVLQVASASTTEPTLAYVQKANALLARHNIPVNSLSTRLLSLWQGGNGPGASTLNNYVEATPRVGYSDNAVGNLNFIMTPKQTLRVQAFVGTGRQVEPSASAGTTNWYFQAAPDITQNFSVAHNWAVTDRFSNTLLVGLGIFNQTFNDNNHSFDIPALGLNTGVTNPSLFGAPTISINNTSNTACAAGAFDCVGATQPLGRKDYTGHITDTATWVKGAHQLRFGGEYRRNYMDLQYQNGVRGNFLFNGLGFSNIAATSRPAGSTPFSSSATQALVCTGQAICGGFNDTDIVGTQTEILALADYMGGYFNSASFIRGNLRRDLYRTDLAFFIQDQYHVSQKVTLNFGVRHEFTGAISSTGPLSVFRPGVAGTDANGLQLVGNAGQPSLYKPGKLHFSPRVGFNWNPSEKLVVRGNYGIFFDNPPFNGFGDNSIGVTGATARGIQANPVAGVANVSLAQGQWVQNQAVFANATAASVVGLFSVDPNLHMAYANNFGLTTEYQVSKKTVFTLAYVGSTGVHNYITIDANQPARWSTSAPGNTTITGANTATNLCSLATNGTNTNCLQQRRPYFSTYRGVGAVTQVSSGAASNYHSLQASLKSNGFHGLTSQVSWTYGHALDNGSGFRSTGPSDSTNLSVDYGNATFDVRHTVNGYVVYEAPQFFHALPALTKGWQVTGFLTAYTSAPFSITVGDNTGRGQTRDRANYSGAAYKTGDSSIQTVAGRKFAQYYVPLAQSPFSIPTFGQTGNTARNQFRGPGFFTFDTSVVKNTQLHEGVNLQVRAEMFNIFNHVNLSTPAVGVTSSTFGQVTSGRTTISSGAPFNVQFAGKLIF